MKKSLANSFFFVWVVVIVTDLALVTSQPGVEWEDFHDYSFVPPRLSFDELPIYAAAEEALNRGGDCAGIYDNKGPDEGANFDPAEIARADDCFFDINDPNIFFKPPGLAPPITGIPPLIAFFKFFRGPQVTNFTQFSSYMKLNVTRTGTHATVWMVHQPKWNGVATLQGPPFFVNPAGCPCLNIPATPRAVIPTPFEFTGGFKNLVGFTCEFGGAPAAWKCLVAFGELHVDIPNRPTTCPCNEPLP